MKHHMFSAAALTVALLTPALHAQQKRPIERADQLPVHSYPVRTTATALFQDQAQFAALARQLEADLRADLAAYDIQDRATLKSYYRTLSNLALLRGDYKAAVAYQDRIRAVEDKPGLRLTTGIVERAMAAAARGRAEPLDTVAFRNAFRREIAALPYSDVQVPLAEMKNRFETFTAKDVPRFVNNRIEPSARSGSLPLEQAQSLIAMRVVIDRLDPVRGVLISELAGVMASHKVAKTDIWAARDVSLEGRTDLTPVTIAIWDSGVDVDLFPGQLFTNPGEVAGNGKDDDGNGYIDDVHGIAYDIDRGRVTGMLQPVSLTPAELVEMRDRQKRIWGDEAGLNTPEAAAVRRSDASVSPVTAGRQPRKLREYLGYMHGTHVAGIAVRGNPAARMLVARRSRGMGSNDFQVPPEPPTMERARAFAQEFRESIAYFRQHGVRVVNMSWGIHPAAYERKLAANNIGTPEERRRLARQIFDVVKTGLHDAMAAAPDMLFVGAAGNQDADVSFNETLPGSFDLPNLITVGAVDAAGDETSFTSYGKVDVYANGYHVLSKVPGGSTLPASGTSMATPQAVNLAAKLLAVYPRLNVAEVKRLILQGAEAKDVSGSRRISLLNEARSFELARGAARAQTAAAPPAAPVRPVTETLHGVAVTDPYRWMEDGGQEFTDWLKAQDAYTRGVLERIPGRAKIAAELRALERARGVGITQPRRVSNRYFYRKRNVAEERVPKLYVRDATTGTERLLVDPVTIQDGNQPWAIPGYAVSPDGRYVAYIATAGGSTVGTLRVMEVATARTLPDTIDRVFQFGRLSWRPDSRAFTFTRFRALRPGAPPEDAQKCPTTFLHVVGTGADRDRPLIGCDITPRIPITDHQQAGVSFSTASPYALGWVVVSSSRTALEFYTAPIDTLSARDVPWHRLASGDDEVTEVVLRSDTAYLRTGHGAPRGKVVRTSVLHPDLAHADVVVAQSDAVIATLEPIAMPQSALYLAKDALYVRMRDAGIGRLLRVPFDTSGATAVPLPFAGSVSQAFARPEDAGITFVLQSWTRAPRVYAFNPESGTVRDTGLAPNNPAERREFEVTEVKARSADGTLVPLTIVGPVGLKKDNSHPTLLEGYGAYGLVSDPMFTPALIPWLERGGLSARCHVRGGGDFGEEWHRAGQGRNKANTIADFIACAEYLVTQGYTTPARLAGMGASAGGLTIGGAITRRPDLFAVAFPVAAVSDLLRFGLAKQLDQAEEFGAVTDPNDFRAMLAVSPYHNITAGTRYPAVLAMTAINDDAVAPWHVGKLVARLQAATTSGKPVLLRVDWSAGHFNLDFPAVDRYSFMLWQMGIPEFQPTGDK
jgi:prolyl oligopeptidase